MEFKATLKELRTQKGISQKELAAKTGFSLSAVVKWETGQYEPRAKVLIALSKYFGVSIDFLLGNID